MLHIPNSAEENCLTEKENHALCLKSDIKSINLRITKISQWESPAFDHHGFVSSQDRWCAWSQIRRQDPCWSLCKLWEHSLDSPPPPGRNIPGLLLFIDFQKAFDTLEWPFISKPHQHFGFGPPLLNCIELFYCNIESCILNNGWAILGLGTGFTLSWGFRQGCPLSPYLFILSAEILADTIRRKTED